MVKQRQSNIELLRIISIFFVLIGHAGIALGGLLPERADLAGNSLQSLAVLVLNAMSVGGVNIFVLISGWFGIRASRRGLGKFLFQVAFLLWGIYAMFLAIGLAPISVDNIKASLGIYEGYWFVMAYLGLYILSPVLNAFVEKATKRQLGLLLILFYLFQIHYCWIWSMVNYFGGYSIVFFCGLYLTARYVRLYPILPLQRHPWSVYLAMVMLLVVLSAVGIYITGKPIKMLRYDCPLVIIASVAIVVGFSKLTIQKRWINALATSCFAVYIVHFHPLVFPYFRQVMATIAATFCGWRCLTAVIVFLCLVFLACSIIDYVRQAAWEIISKHIH